MSIISIYETDKSDILYSRFASLAASYLEHPATAKTSTARVPLENLYRLLEMFRYDAFSDESRNGVLEIESIDEHIATHAIGDKWHTKIEHALGLAQASVFAQIPKDQAIDELEATLTRLATEEDIGEPIRTNAKSFFEKFHEELG